MVKIAKAWYHTKRKEFYEHQDQTPVVKDYIDMESFYKAHGPDRPAWRMGYILFFQILEDSTS